MNIDSTTLNDLSIFHHEDEYSVFHKINLTLTARGKEQLKKNLAAPFSDLRQINDVQDVLKLIISRKKDWPVVITNGTVMVVERFFEANIDAIPSNPSPVGAFSYKILHSHDFSLVKYSVKHCFDFIKGMMDVTNHFLTEDTPAPLKTQLEDAKKILSVQEMARMANIKSAADLTPADMLKLGYFIRHRFRNNMHSLLDIFGRLDAWYGMAMATEKFRLIMPLFEKSETPFIEANGLYHLMVDHAVAYDAELNREHNFLFLTGANMAGKSTFIKACGVAVYLAHTGMGVPAKKMKLSCFDGLLSNINITDNVVKGESFFFNEVQRIKNTIQKISDGKNWLILIDELFKGTNVQDAMKCSKAVIEGLLKMRNAVFILSTHLYEIGEELRHHPNIVFNYFETAVIDGGLSFSYQLKEGISNDRLGYLILQREGVVKLLDGL